MPGKAAPGYRAAKQIIKLVNYLGEVINRDARVHDWLKVDVCAGLPGLVGGAAHSGGGKVGPQGVQVPSRATSSAHIWSIPRSTRAIAATGPTAWPWTSSWPTRTSAPTRSWSDRFPGPAEVYGAPQGTRTQGYFPGGARSSGRTPLPEIKEPKVKKGRPRFLSQEIMGSMTLDLAYFRPDIPRK